VFLVLFLFLNNNHCNSSHSCYSNNGDNDPDDVVLRLFCATEVASTIFIGVGSKETYLALFVSIPRLFWVFG